MNKFLVLLGVSLALIGNAQAKNLGGGFEGPGVSTVSVAEASKLPDDTAVTLIGSIEKSLGDEKYLFKDKTGSIVVEIDDDDWRGLTVKPENTIEIRGDVDKEMFRDSIIDVDYISVK